MYSWTTSRPRQRPATIAVLVAVCLTAMMSVVAIVLDGGLLLDDRWRAQAAADAAALAAAADLYSNWYQNNGLDVGGTAKTAALSTAAANGYGNDGTTSTVTVNIPPQSGDHSGQPGYAEVIIRFNQPRSFSGIFRLFNHQATGDIPVTARTVARGMMVSTMPAGIICLNPTAAGALSVTGKGNVVAHNGAIIVDSNSSQAVTTTSQGTVIAPEVDITGKKPGYSGTITTTPVSGNILTGQPPTPDPLATLPAPDPSTMPVRSTQTVHAGGNTTLTLQPGVYIGGIALTGKGAVVLEPGIYYLEGGGISASGQGSLSGAGVMLYNAPGAAGGSVSFNLSGSGSVNISPPTSGTYQGISIFQARNAASSSVSISGNGNTNITGTVYAPNSPVTVTGNGDASIGSEFICDTLTVTGNGDVNIWWPGKTSTKKRDLRVVE